MSLLCFENILKRYWRPDDCACKLSENYNYIQIARATLWHPRAKLHTVYAHIKGRVRLSYFLIVETHVNSWVKW
jgi:hypothetical protein